MESEEILKLVDGIYKNILEQFNPGARQMINAGKTYLKALHNAAAASQVYVDAIRKLAKQAQQGTWGDSSDIGSTLLKIVDVYNDVQEQQMNMLKAFYVDLLVPLETNVEKDAKVVQSEQKRFISQHKQRIETYQKAVTTIKKQRKKPRNASKLNSAMDKELKNMQILEKEKTNLDAFCEQSLKNAMIQQRRRYGFVLERQCSLIKHCLSYHIQGVSAYQPKLNLWFEVAKARELLPDSVQNMFNNKLKLTSEDEVYSNPKNPNIEDDKISISSIQIKENQKNSETPHLDSRRRDSRRSPESKFIKAKSENNLNQMSQQKDSQSPSRNSKALTHSSNLYWEDAPLAKALYEYSSEEANQLHFLEGDLILLVGDRNKGWQFGENLRTQKNGWFPSAYTELLNYSIVSTNNGNYRSSPEDNEMKKRPYADTSLDDLSGKNVENMNPRMFGDTMLFSRRYHSSRQTREAIDSNMSSSAPSLPAPIPSQVSPKKKFEGSPLQTNLNRHSSTDEYLHQPRSPISHRISKSASSNNFFEKDDPSEFGFRNEREPKENEGKIVRKPPPQPEVDYSEDESITEERVNTKRDVEYRRTNEAKTLKSSKSPHIEEQTQESSKNANLELFRNKHSIKRTKSLWRFRKSTSDMEILEGMALWKHRDLVDIDQEKLIMLNRKISVSRDKSLESTKTITNEVQQENVPRRVNKTHQDTNEDQKILSKNKVVQNQNQKMDSYINDQSDHDDFSDDSDDLTLKPVNRKNILQQYNSFDQDTDSYSEISNDDPYDSIVVSDQNFARKDQNISNVAKISQQLEKLSSKYNSKILNNIKTNQIEQNNNNIRNNADKLYFDKLNNAQIRVRNPSKIQNSKSSEKKVSRKDSMTNDKYKTDKQQQNNNKSKKYDDIDENYLNQQRRSKNYYDDYDNKAEERYYNMKNKKSAGEQPMKKDKRHQQNVMRKDEMSDTLTSRQTSRQSKISRTDSNASSKEYSQKYDKEYHRRHNSTDYESNYNDVITENGNMYGPWYDLWNTSSIRKNK